MTLVGARGRRRGDVCGDALLRTVLFETPAHDPLVFVAVPLVLGVVALLALYVPARRAASVDPLIEMHVD